MLKKGDLVLILVLIIFSISAYFLFKYISQINDATTRIAIIRQNNQIIEEVQLDDTNPEQRIYIDGNYPLVILFEDGRIRFEEATCPDKLCVYTGWINTNGSLAVCLPNRTTIKIEGGESVIDGVTY